MGQTYGRGYGMDTWKEIWDGCMDGDMGLTYRRMDRVGERKQQCCSGEGGKYEWGEGLHPQRGG